MVLLGVSFPDGERSKEKIPCVEAAWSEKNLQGGRGRKINDLVFSQAECSVQKWSVEQSIESITILYIWSSSFYLYKLFCGCISDNMYISLWWPRFEKNYLCFIPAAIVWQNKHFAHSLCLFLAKLCAYFRCTNHQFWVLEPFTKRKEDCNQSWIFMWKEIKTLIMEQWLNAKQVVSGTVTACGKTPFGQ